MKPIPLTIVTILEHKKRKSLTMYSFHNVFSVAEPKNSFRVCEAVCNATAN